MSKLVDADVRKVHDALAEVIKRLHQLTLDIKNKQLQQTIDDLRNRMSDPFMFVIVGEVKAGKSTFINALLETDEEVTATGVAPVTDSIQQIVYGENEETVEINENLVKIYRDIPILEDIAIVDTPGTNTIVEHHQEITERFVPMSDLVVFVFDAKNPYRKSAWEFFEFIQQEWHKKVIFVLQQKDLMDVEDLKINIKGLEDHASANGVQEPHVFAVSAKDEIENKENSGFNALREWISLNITGGQAPFLKLENILEISETLMSKINAGIKDRKKQLELDIVFRNDIRKTLDAQEKKALQYVDNLVNNLVDGYNRIALEKKNEIKSDLGFFTVLGRAFASIFSKKTSPKENLNQHLEELELKLNDYWSKKLDDGLTDLADSIKQMTNKVEYQIEKSTTILKNDHSIYSNIAEKRNAVLSDLRETFQSFRSEKENFIDKKILRNSQQIATNVTTGSGLAVVGIIVTVVTKITVFDVTGGILTALGVSLAGITLSIKKRKIIKTYEREIQKGEAKLTEELSDVLKGYINTIKTRVDDNFDNFDAHIENEKQALQEIAEQKEYLINNMDQIRQDINKLKPTSDET